jgi:hypothetical protein
MQNYKDWILRWLRQPTPAGDLARRIYADKDFPAGGNRETILARLKKIGMTEPESIPFYAGWKIYLADRHKRIREVSLESQLVKEVESRGAKCWKFVSPGMVGVPDRICILPNGRVVFVEMKAPGRPLQPLQVKRAEELKKLGHRVYKLDSVESIQRFLQEVIPI